MPAGQGYRARTRYMFSRGYRCGGAGPGGGSMAWCSLLQHSGADESLWIGQQPVAVVAAAVHARRGAARPPPG